MLQPTVCRQAYEHCSKLKPVAEAADGAGPGQGRGGCAVFAGRLPVGRQADEQVAAQESARGNLRIRRRGGDFTTRDNMREELGDVLLQSVFQARVCESDTEDPFGIDEVADRFGEQAHHSASACVCGWMMPAIPLILLMLLMLTVTTGEKLPNPNPRKLCWLYGKR